MKQFAKCIAYNNCDNNMALVIFVFMLASERVTHEIALLSSKTSIKNRKIIDIGHCDHH